MFLLFSSLDGAVFGFDEALCGTALRVSTFGAEVKGGGKNLEYRSSQNAGC